MNTIWIKIGLTIAVYVTLSLLVMGAIIYFFKKDKKHVKVITNLQFTIGVVLYLIFSACPVLFLNFQVVSNNVTIQLRYSLIIDLIPLIILIVFVKAAKYFIPNLEIEIQPSWVLLMFFAIAFSLLTIDSGMDIWQQKQKQQSNEQNGSTLKDVTKLIRVSIEGNESAEKVGTIPGVPAHKVWIYKTYQSRKYIELDDGTLLRRNGDTTDKNNVDVTKQYEVAPRSTYYAYKVTLNGQLSSKDEKSLNGKKFTESRILLADRNFRPKKSAVKSNTIVHDYKISEIAYEDSLSFARADIENHLISSEGQIKPIHKEIIPGYDLYGTNKIVDMKSWRED
ncbi:hypothetical protein JOC36_001497 [Weissella uvarum]|uniref:hypothetical protein n=1 Tax=Weissella uvarum TaxID=1479233 RepID=UPI001961BC65|nr:hypothetical protein [Weissella uvarum]MBM7617904.1 hypothetical protein [Weissella uvarum]MCM0596099.1 hypothetical protein [Weissella uvarum]